MVKNKDGDGRARQTTTVEEESFRFILKLACRGARRLLLNQQPALKSPAIAAYPIFASKSRTKRLQVSIAYGREEHEEGEGQLMVQSSSVTPGKPTHRMTFKI